MLEIISDINSYTKKEAQKKLIDDLAAISAELSVVAKKAVEYGRKQNLLAQKEEKDEDRQ